MNLAIWSKNPTKIKSVLDAAKKSPFLQKRDLNAFWFDVDSRVSDMPSSLEETLEGARNRAHNLVNLSDADFFIWIEWGVSIIQGKAYLFWATHILWKSWEEHFWLTSFLEIPEKYKKWVYEEWLSLWELHKKYNDNDTVWVTNGSYWVWTQDAITRVSAFEAAFHCAISPFFNAQYKK